MKMKLNLTLLIILTALFSCAHHKDVRPGVKGIHKVTVQANDSEQGARDAVDQAQNFCEKRNMNAAFINEDKKYTGDMDENSYKTVKKASKIAQIVGGSVWVFGRKRGTQGLGGLASLGGTAADIATGKGYTVEMSFKCI